MDTAILARVEDFCIREGLLQPGAPQHLAAAVSGGADSMALLLLLRQLQPRFGYTLSACHVNHGLRGQSADRDEAFVRAECARLGVPLRVFHAAELASPPAHAGEDWARRLRYTAFAQLQGQGIDAIATAHTANDQAETLLLRLARGTGLHGAGGIRPRRGCYLRPLLCLSRAETEAVCRTAGQLWVTDETNDTDAYARNRLRHSALPALESTNAAAVQNLARFCEKAARVDAYLAAGAARLLAAARLPGAEPAWQLAPLQVADPLLLETALHSLVAPVRDAEEKYVQLLCAVVRQGSGAVQLTGQVRFCAGNGCLRQETLPDAAIDVWFTADPLRASGQNKIAALNAAASAFQTLYPNVELRLQSIAPDQYKQRLKQAQQDGSLPVLFERTAQSTDLACNAKALRQLNRQYDPAGFRLGAPVSGDYAVLGLGLPVLYASNACAEGIGFDFRQASSATLASLAGLDLKAGMDASFLPAYEVLFQSSIPETDSMTVSADALDAFLSGEQGLYYGSTADAADVQTQLAGRYQLYAVQSPERACMLQNVWSVTQQSSKKETACAVRFLSYLLSEDGQRCLYLENQYPSIPVSSTVYEQYRNIAGELADVLTDAKPRPCGIV